MNLNEMAMLSSSSNEEHSQLDSSLLDLGVKDVI